MSTESGDNKLIGNFRKLIDEVSADPAYNPANNKLKVTALEAQYTAADAAAAAVAAARAPNKLAMTDRETAFRGLRALAVRSRNFLKASGAPKGVVDDADTSIRKLSGGRKSPKLKDDPATPADESKGSSSASQMSYDNQVGHFESYIEIVRNVPAYNPNEADLKVTALDALAASLTAKSNAVSTTSATLNQSRGQRDQLLYLSDDSIVNTAKLVKAYVQAALGSQSQLYKKIKGLEFTRQRKDS
ncbi:MAG TPA: hypothetical protein VGO73_05935 [Pyrinomonadaceae bacterium]|jgi:hypothetical protein|nr:hypothetical protein [Pyrinomonadaceae bacterium]